MTRTDAVKWLKAVVYVGIYGGLFVPLVFVPVVIFPFVFSKLIFFQVLIGLTFPAYLALAWAEPKYRPKWVPLYGAIVAYFIAVALSVVFASDVSRAWWGNQERMNGLFTLLHFFAWFTMASSILTTWKQWRKILIFQVILSGVMASVALLQVPFPKLLLFPVTDRPGGLVDNPIYMAGYQIFSFFFIALLWLRGSSKSLKIWLSVIAALDLGAFLIAQSRGALAGLGVGIAVFAVAYAFMSKSKKTKFAVIGLAIAAFLSYGLIYALRDTSFIKATPLARLTNLQVTTETRFIAWKIGWQGFLERPLTGWGFDDFHILFNLKYNPKSLEFGYYETWFDRAHNTVVDSLAMTGIFGFLTYFGIFGALFYSVIRAKRKGWIDVPTTGILIGLPVAYFVQNLFVFDQPAGFTMSFFLYAFVVSCTTAHFMDGSDHAGTTKTSRPVPWAVFGFLMVCSLVVVWCFSILPWKASKLSIDSNNYFAAGRYAEAYAFAQKAASTTTPYLDEQTFLQSRNLMALADNNALDRAPMWKEWYTLVNGVYLKYLDQHPLNTNPLFIYARLLDSFSTVMPENIPQAEIYYQKALDTSPKRQQILFSFGRFYIQSAQKQKDPALQMKLKQQGYDMFKRAMDADPNVGESRWYAGLSQLYDLGQREDGAKTLASAVTGTIPYLLKNANEAGALIYAYDILNDKAGMQDVIEELPDLPSGTIPLYIDIAKITEHQGLIDERNRILGALARIDQTVALRLGPLINGTATSIDASLKMTEGLTVTSTPPAVAATSPTTSTTIPAAPSGPGPRVK